MTCDQELLNNLGCKIGILILLSVVSGFVVLGLLNLLNDRYEKERERRKLSKKLKLIEELTLNKRLAFINGTIEVMMYSTSILIGLPFFIVFWIGVKTALKWDSRKRKKGKDSKTHILTKYVYLRFLIGNALSIILSIIIYVLIKLEIICS